MITSALPAALLTVAALTGPPRGEVLDFTATWCVPCQQMSPLVSRLKELGYPIRQIDVDENPALAEKLGIKSIPAFVLVVDGEVKARKVGIIGQQELLSLFAQIPTDPPVRTNDPPADPLVRTAGNDAPPRSFDREAAPPRDPAGGAQTRPGELTRPVAEMADSKSPHRTPSFTNSDDSESSGFLDKLFGRDKQPQTPETPSVVRANDDRQTGQPENALPVRNPVEASVRLHVTINGQTHLGSGTAIDSRIGKTIIVSCGHLFDGWNEQSKVEVDLFVGGRPQRYVGSMIYYDPLPDVGLIAIPTDTIVPTAEIAASASRPRVGEAVVSIGCSGGAPPSQERLQVTALNYYECPDNIECTGVPVQGRSGGGLFNLQGQLVGLCIAADAERHRGAYAGLVAIHNLLASSGLADLGQPAVAAASPEGRSPRAVDSLEPVSKAGGGLAPAHSSEAAAGAPGRFDLPVQGTAGSTEVICIIQQPGAPSRIVIIDHPSQKFLSFLDGEMARRDKGLRTNNISAESNHFAPTDFQTPDEPAPEQPWYSQGQPNRVAGLQPTVLAKPLPAQR
jgi:thiol-disulfide isomerase/thioredoxin/S1-C subfamily serine protease